MSFMNLAISRHDDASRSRAQIYSVALLALGAAAIHFAVVPDHLRDFPLHGVFFIALGLIQVAFAVAVVARPDRRLFALGAAGTMGVICLYVATRTVGLPVAPQPWQPEPVGFPDVAATLLEAISVLLLLLLVRTPRRPRRRGRVRVALSTFPAAFFGGLIAFIGVGSALTPMEDAISAAPPLAGGQGVSVSSLVAAPGNELVKTFTLTARTTRIGADEFWTYNGTIPGPELRVNLGDRVRVTLINHLSKPTSIHWHGVRLPNSQDGVAGITQDAVQPGSSHTYEFIANDAGTFWYHSHQNPMDQIPRGLLGALVVMPRGGQLQAARDYSLLLHNRPGGLADIGVNGSSNLHLDAKPGDTVRLRLINGIAMMAGAEPIAPVVIGAPYVVAALDGHDVNRPEPLGPQRLMLGMGQRADVVFNMPAAGAVRIANLISPAPLPLTQASIATVTVGDGPLPASVNAATLPRFDLTRYGSPAADEVADAKSFDVNAQLVIEIAGPVFRNGMFDGIDTFNGAASPHVPPMHVHEGDGVRIHIVNKTEGTHPIHIHGHVFSVLSKGTHPVTGSPIHLDAILVGPHETWDVAFKADNPGIWMLHCHVLGHAAHGMSMTINYEGISTPFTMGMHSGNVPE
jgi:FtsP/CotA-like multicopper oxidase with cupredoxin domain